MKKLAFVARAIPGKGISSRVPAIALAAGLLAAPAAAFAQTLTPTLVGNPWPWRHHQPTELEVQKKEKAAGIEPTASQSAMEAAEMDRVYRQLLSRSLGYGPTSRQWTDEE